MHKRLKFRIKPNKKQELLLNEHLEECRLLYNHFLAERKNAWDATQAKISCYDQIKTLPLLKKDFPSLRKPHSQVLQDVAFRIDLAFKGFFRRCKAGETPGYPRFKGKGRYHSLTYTQYGEKRGCYISANMLHLVKIGSIKIILHRPLEGIPKVCNIKRTSTGKWYAALVCEIEQYPLEPTDQSIGLDVGLVSFYTTSDGEKIGCPKFFRHDEHDLARAQRKLFAAKKGSAERRKRRHIVNTIYERITNRRTNFAHQESRKIVNQYDVIIVEDLSVNAMVHNHCLSKSIHDASWSLFTEHLSYKAAYAGRQFVAVNPAYTSQDCSRCGHRQKKTLKDRVHECPCCQLILDRDHNAALNILRLGQQSLGLTPESSQ